MLPSKITALVLSVFVLSLSVLSAAPDGNELGTTLQVASKGKWVDIERAFPKLRFHRPVFLTGAGDGRNQLYVVEQEGVIQRFDNIAEEEQVNSSEVFLDIRDRISRAGNEEGLLGLAFHPEFRTNGRFYVHYSSKIDDTFGIIARFRTDPDNPSRADSDSEEILLRVKQPYRNHNGGTIAFGPDGYLYISFGDGGSANDPHSHGQNLTTWLGAILRIDVDRKQPGLEYAIPSDNPFVETKGAKPELWAIGLRNAWRMSFDRKTGQLYAADVGQDRKEEVNLVERGGNYGWNRYEADLDFRQESALATESVIAPIATYERNEGISITGGCVYRGKCYPALDGQYFFGDYVTGNLWRLIRQDDGGYEKELVRRTGRSIASFGEDDRGEVYLLSFDGGIYRIVPSDQPESMLVGWPKRLSETGLYTSVTHHTPAKHLVAYNVNAPFWSDGANKTRYFALPEGKKLGYRSEGVWEIPVGTTFVKEFDTPGDKPRKLETRLIKRTAEGWEGATYVWDARLGDGVLRPEGQQFETNLHGKPASWHAPSASECASCHIADDGYVLGINTRQLNFRDPNSGNNQIETWASQGLINLPKEIDLSREPAFCDPHDESEKLATRARVWLDVNCAMCHRPEGRGNADIDLRFETPLDKTRLLNEKPKQGNLGIKEGLLVKVGDAAKSLLHHRVQTLSTGRMPNVGTNQIDKRGVKLLEQWIEQELAQ